MKVFAGTTVAALLFGAVFGQSTRTGRTFEAADVHVSPQINNDTLRMLGTNFNFRTSLRGERYEVHNATMLDLVRTAYTVDIDRVVGEPNWLELNRFDITALVPPNTSQATLKVMLQSLLADRFRLVMHNDIKRLPAFVLSISKGKPKLKEATSVDKTGCQSQRQLSPVDQTIMMNISCRNATMEALASELNGLGGGGYVTNTVVDSTELTGSWDFDLKFTDKISQQRAGTGSTLFDAIDKQLGLNLVEQELSAQVIVVDHVNEKPSANPADVARKLPPPPPAQFEVAVIKPTNPGDPVRSGVQVGGTVTISGRMISLKSLVAIAWNLNPNEELAGAPKWLDSARFDIIAKLPAAFIGANAAAAPLQEMLQSLLIDRFKMKVHYEDRPVAAFALVPAKPKLKKADPLTRSRCKSVMGGGIVLPTTTVSCQNMTMTQFSDELQTIARPIGGPYVHYHLADATGLEGGWDFSFSFSPLANPSTFNGAANSPFGVPATSDPVGVVSLFEAIDKQLGLKLEAQKRTYPVFIIDHIEEKPTEN